LALQRDVAAEEYAHEPWGSFPDYRRAPEVVAFLAKSVPITGPKIRLRNDSRSDVPLRALIVFRIPVPRFLSAGRGDIPDEVMLQIIFIGTLDFMPRSRRLAPFPPSRPRFAFKGPSRPQGRAACLVRRRTPRHRNLRCSFANGLFPASSSPPNEKRPFFVLGVSPIFPYCLGPLFVDRRHGEQLPRNSTSACGVLLRARSLAFLSPMALNEIPFLQCCCRRHLCHFGPPQQAAFPPLRYLPLIITATPDDFPLVLVPRAFFSNPPQTHIVPYQKATDHERSR